MFRKTRESLNIMFDLGKQYAAEDNPTSLSAAFRIFSTLQESYPDKACQGQLGKVKEKLMRLGLLDKAIEDMKRIEDAEAKKQLSSYPVSSKLSKL